MLYGMADPIKGALRTAATRTRIRPVGELIPGMGYLVRRCSKTTSNTRVFSPGFFTTRNPEQLLREPKITIQDTGTEHLVYNPRQEFHNCPHLDFSLEENRRAVRYAIDNIVIPRVFARL